MKDHLKTLAEIKKRYEQGENITSYFKKNENVEKNSFHAIQIAYDLQAGSYIKSVKENKEFNFNYTAALAKVISKLNGKSILEAGVGEATTLANVISKLEDKEEIESYGFDVSWSRVKYAQEYCQHLGLRGANLFVGDLFNTPLLPNSIDIVYTSHSIEPNGGREKEALQELYSITRKYLVLLEPSYELANEEGRKRMERLGYVKGIEKTAKDLGYEVIEHRLFDYCINPLNPTAITIIKKKVVTTGKEEASPFACPVTNSSLSKKSTTTFFSDNSLLAYPILEGIPCLMPQNAIIATQFNNFTN